MEEFLKNYVRDYLNDYGANGVGKVRYPSDEAMERIVNRLLSDDYMWEVIDDAVSYQCSAEGLLEDKN